MKTRTKGWRLTTLMLAALASPAMAAEQETSGDASKKETSEKATPTTSVVVGKAKLNWYMEPAPLAPRTTEAMARFRQVSAAHLGSAELPPAGEAAPETPADEAVGLRLPADLISTMFVDGDGGQYCSDGSDLPSTERKLGDDGEEGR